MKSLTNQSPQKFANNSMRKINRPREEHFWNGTRKIFVFQKRVLKLNCFWVANCRTWIDGWISTDNFRPVLPSSPPFTPIFPIPQLSPITWNYIWCHQLRVRVESRATSVPLTQTITFNKMIKHYMTVIEKWGKRALGLNWVNV